MSDSHFGNANGQVESDEREYEEEHEGGYDEDEFEDESKMQAWMQDLKSR
eukprot:SAG31_NODE_9451_length_1275_cov_1.164966_1_plen_50_part_00